MARYDQEHGNQWRHHWSVRRRNGLYGAPRGEENAAFRRLTLAIYHIPFQHSNNFVKSMKIFMVITARLGIHFVYLSVHSHLTDRACHRGFLCPLYKTTSNKTDWRVSPLPASHSQTSLKAEMRKTIQRMRLQAQLCSVSFQECFYSAWCSHWCRWRPMIKFDHFFTKIECYYYSPFFSWFLDYCFG